jgi:membrane protein
MPASIRLITDLGNITKNTFTAWLKADPFRQSSIVAYSAIFSIPALLVIVISCAGLIFGREAILGEISSQISGAINANAAKQVEEIIAKAGKHSDSVVAAIISTVTLILGSIGVFAELQTSLNLIWDVKITAKKKWLKSLQDRLLSFGLVLSVCFLMLVSLMLTAALQALGDWIKAYLPDVLLYVFKLLNFILSLSIIGVLFALIFKFLPDAKVRWRDVWIGALVTTLLFILGKFALGFYFAKTNPGSVYGAAGSVILIMLWVSYSCMILFFGAEFTKQYAVFYGRKAEPKRYAEIISTEQKEKEK